MVVVKKSPSLPSTDAKGNQARCPSLVKKAKKNKGSAHPSDFTLGPSEASTMGMKAKDRAF